MDFSSETEDYDWEDGEGYLSALISLRSDILNEDLRSLYIGWLLAVQSEELEYEDSEPPVPPGLNNLSGPLMSLVDYLRIDQDLLAVAAKESSDCEVESEDDLALWIKSLPINEKDNLLLDVITGRSPHLRQELLKQYKTQQKDDVSDDTKECRTVEQLLDEAAGYANERKAREEKEKERKRIQREKEIAEKRAQYLNLLSKKVPETWTKIDSLIDQKKVKEYDQAVNLLKDLRDVGERFGSKNEVQSKIKSLYEVHNSKSALKKRMRDAGLVI